MLIVEQIVKGIGSILGRFIGDATKREQALAEIRLVVVAGASVWGPLGVSAVISVVALDAYLIAVALLGRPLIYEVILLMAAIPFSAFGVSFRDWLTARQEWRRQRENEH